MDSNPYFNDELFGFRQKQGLKRTIVSVWEILLNSHLLVTINEKRTKKNGEINEDFRRIFSNYYISFRNSRAFGWSSYWISQYYLKRREKNEKNG